MVMKKKKEEILAIIPARGGSKRIKNKNLINFFGKPLISYSIDAALQTKIFDQIFISTDSYKILKTVKKHNINIPFLRSKKNSSDNATIRAVLLEVINKLKKNNLNFKYCCCIYPTAVFIKKKQIIESFELLKKNRLDSVLSISKHENVILKSLSKNKKDIIKMNYPKYKDKMSQYFKDSYYDAGQFFWINVASFLKSKNIVTSKTGSITIPNIMCQDINTKEDLMQAKFKHLYFKSLRKTGNNKKYD
jgi:pseudaminic acid cytidylyltransferase